MLDVKKGSDAITRSEIKLLQLLDDERKGTVRAAIMVPLEREIVTVSERRDFGS